MSKFLPWIDSASAANCQTHSDFDADTQRINGFMSGTLASAIRVNSGLRQANLVVAALMDSILPTDSALDLTSEVEDVEAAISKALIETISYNSTLGDNYGAIQLIKFDGTSESLGQPLYSIRSGTADKLNNKPMSDYRGHGTDFKYSVPTSETNLNSLKTEGYYFLNTNFTNRPTSVDNGQGFLEVAKEANGYVKQTFTGKTTGAIATRVFNGSTWSEWSSFHTYYLHIYSYNIDDSLCDLTLVIPTFDIITSANAKEYISNYLRSKGKLAVSGIFKSDLTGSEICSATYLQYTSSSNKVTVVGHKFQVFGTDTRDLWTVGSDSRDRVEVLS